MKANLNDMDDMIVDSYMFKSIDGYMRCIKTGSNGIIEIRYHPPSGEGDKHFVDVYRDNGDAWRDFHVESVLFKRKDIE